MNELRYQLSKLKERIVIGFWHRIPSSWLYWAVNESWARATTDVFTDRTPNAVSWDMMQRYLSGKIQRRNTGAKKGTLNETLSA